MSFQIVGVHVESPRTHERHISKVKLKDGTVETRKQVVNYIDNLHLDYYYTVGGGRKPRVITSTSSSGTKYIRTHPDDTTRDNLLSLPRF